MKRKVRLDNVLQNLSNLIRYTQDLDIDADDRIFIIKLYDHIKLAERQVMEIYSVIDKAKDDINEKNKNTLECIEREIVVKLSDKLNPESRTAQRGYVVVLSVFTAIMVSVFSTLSVGSSMYSIVGNNFEKGIVATAFIGSLVIAFIYILIYSIFALSDNMGNKNGHLIKKAIWSIVIFGALAIVICVVMGK